MLEKSNLLWWSLGAMRPVLKRAYGWRWPMALVRALLSVPRLMSRTRWAGRKDAEARYVRTLAFLPALCLDLKRRLGDRAPVVNLVAAVVNAAHEQASRTAGLHHLADPCERWHAYFDRMLVRGAGAYNENECVSLDPQRFHARVYRCVFAELAQETGVPELGGLVCDLDISFHQRLFPTFQFHRNGSVRNTLAHGGVCCEYVWERRAGNWKE